MMTGSGLLASSPADFANSSDIVLRPILSAKRSPYTMTNKGLAIEVPISANSQTHRHGGGEEIALVLNCFQEQCEVPSAITVRLRNFDNGVWRRINCDKLTISGLVKRVFSNEGDGIDPPSTTMIYVKQDGL